MVKRSRCVFDCETQRHLYSTFELQVININALDVKRPQGSFRQVLRRKSYFYLRLYCDFCGTSMLEILSLKNNQFISFIYSQCYVVSSLISPDKVKLLFVPNLSNNI